MSRTARRALIGALSAVVLAGVAQAPATAASLAPINDDYDLATVIQDFPYGDALDTSGATADPADPPCAGSAATVWYTVVGDGSTLLLETAGSDYDTAVGVYLGRPSPDYQLTCADTGIDGSPQASVSLNTVAGYQYTVMVGAANGGSGGLLDFVVRHPTDPVPPLIPPPPNDYSSNATVISALPFTVAEDVSGAGGDGGPTTYCGSWYSVWFSYTPTTDVHIAFDTLGSDYDTQLGVYYEDEFGWETAACNGDALGTLQSRVELDLPAGRTFLIGVAAEYRFDPPDPGTLVFHAEQVTPLTVTATVDSARLLTYGMAEVTGHLSCSRPATAGVTLELSQTLSRRSAHGWGQTSVESCGNSTPFTVQVLPDAAPGFTTGRATYTVTAEADSLDVRSSSSTTGEVRLRNR